jgi:hypothetical protein
MQADRVRRTGFSGMRSEGRVAEVWSLGVSQKGIG